MTVLPGLQDVLNRMKQAHERGKGMRISVSELAEMSCSIFGEIWSQPDPRHLTSAIHADGDKLCDCEEPNLHPSHPDFCSDCNRRR